MRIKVLFTGGTIGSSVGDDAVISTDSATAGKLLIQKFLTDSNSAHKTNVSFDVEEPYSCLSEDLTVPIWNKLIATLQTIDYGLYDGIIITHGTDTMAYTANLLSVLLAGISIPVILVGSNHVLTDPRANGNQNFSDAVDFIADGSYCGVYVIFSGKVYLGSRILQCRPFTDDYDSVSGVDFAGITDGTLHKISHIYNPSAVQIMACKKDAKEWLLNTIGPLLPNSVLLLQPFVGLDYRDIQPGKHVKAILHGLYHSATACVGDAGPLSENSILSLSQRCEKLGILLFIVPFKEALLKDEAQYSTTNEMLKYGVQMACDMSVEMAYTKLLIAVSLYGTDANKCAEFVNTNLFFERLIEY